MKTYIFHVNGMHCSACPTLIKSELEDIPEIANARASLTHHRVEVTGDFGEKEPEHIARDLSDVLRAHGYTLSVLKKKYAVRWPEFALAVPVAGAFIAFFIILQKLGIVNLITGGNVTYGTAFIIGFVASVSTCMAVVGGLVLSMSANFAKGGDSMRPQILFHFGRLVSFFLLGGLVGLLGSVFTLGATSTFVLNFIVALVLLVLGINLLDVFPRLKRYQPTLPGFVSRHVHGLRKLNHNLTPVLIGVATFFLPCGFTQSMQIYTLTTESFWSGAFTMLVFALGTLPVLALLSFSSLTIHKKVQSGIFFKTAGLVVIFFGALNLMNGFVAAGIIAPLFSL